MRILFSVILFLFSFLLQSQTIHYVDPDGSDLSGDGTSGNPYKTIPFAASKVTASGHTIFINNGSYAVNVQINLATGVNLIGESENGVQISSTYAGSGEPLIKLYTANGWLYDVGNQEIANMTLDGNLTTYAAIYVTYRSDVSIHDITFYNFSNIGVSLKGYKDAGEWTTDNPWVNDGINPRTGRYYEYNTLPDYWGVNNAIYNCTFFNCSAYNGTRNDGSGQGAIRVGTQNGALIHHNYIDQTDRVYGQNGYGIKFGDRGFNKNCKIYDNTIITALMGDNPWGFAIEWWWDLGGTEIYNNTIYGGLDLVDMVDHYGVGYSVKVYDNFIGRDALQYTIEWGILLEGIEEYVQVYRNKIQYISRGIYVPRQNYTGKDRLFHVDINTNLFLNMGIIGNEYETRGILYPDFRDEAETEYLYIRNNVFHASTSSSSSTSYYAIMLPNVYDMSKIYIENNIAVNWDGAWIIGRNSRVLADSIFIRNNLAYNNGYNNEPDYDSGFLSSLTNYTYPVSPSSDATIKYDPRFNTDFSLRDLSPAIRQGRDVGLTVDYIGNSWLNPPSIGAYEYITSGGLAVITTTLVTNITTTTATSGGLIKETGGTPIVARGVCWSTSANPTIDDSHTNEGAGFTDWVSDVTGLSDMTTYYLRAYATNSSGTAYGNERIFTTPVQAFSGFIKHDGIMFFKMGDDILLIFTE